ncbi:peptidoglycan-binding domain-containing protein [Paracoccus litorisediminis]|jgi:cell division septation protein DedD|uniref:Peptidoglycan-binding protein n=1 Tax=Paracoccus litorisediminis TaxID=2006130 RepID=A0A844HFN9_9RHOB|nr:peptidoglycan-binding domain-containing protein [Paracoccus litorisediminis]MTH58416.1 peptidoglycan-binding protein [Paracoccus litorisediminis]
MRRFAFIFGATLPLVGVLPALAEDVLIRIEAKRGTEIARNSAERWGAQFDDVVTFPLGDGWTGIALGPMPREQATSRLQTLKSDGKVPGDSFISPAAGRDVTQVGGQPAAAVPTAALEATPTPAAPAVPEAAPAVGSASTFPTDPAATAPVIVAEPVPEPEPVQYYLRIESSPDRDKAEELLAKRRETLPEAGLWTLSNGRSAVAIGPMDEATGKAWLAAFRRANAVPKDAFLAPLADMGDPAVPGRAPELGAPPAEDAPKPEMPALEDIQRALRWAGHYDGAIDGKDGPMTQNAIAEEIVRLRASPDTAAAMHELIRRREAWRAEMGLTGLRDTHTGLAMPAPMDRLQFDRAERALSIYGPKDGSGAALILFSQPGGQQEMLDLAGLVTALGWVPAPKRDVRKGSVTLDGRNQTHISHAEGKVIEDRVQGFVLIWPATDPEEQRRIAAEISDNLGRFAPAAGEAVPEAPAIPPAETVSAAPAATPATIPVP